MRLELYTQVLLWEIAGVATLALGSYLSRWQQLLPVVQAQ